MGFFESYAGYHYRTDEGGLSQYMSEKLFVTLDDISLSGKRVLVRVDFNVPLKNGAITDDARIRACVPTIKKILAAGSSVILMSHLGRPKEGKFDPALSLAPVAAHLSGLLELKVHFVPDWSETSTLENQKVALMENVRFLPGESANDDKLSRKMAALADVYVNDAFAVAHRIQASTHGVAKYSPVACAGPLLVREMEALTKAFAKPARPMTAIVGGSKVSTKLGLLESLLQRVDHLIVGGGIANTFLKAAGYHTGLSLSEPDLLQTASGLMKLATEQGKTIPLPVDVVCGKSFSEDAEATVKSVEDIEDNDLILDVGPKTAGIYAAMLSDARTIIWNGPIGVFEFDQFSNGTQVLAKAIADSNAFSVAGGGDTLAAIAKFGVGAGLSYITTAGGAFLEFLEGKTLPAIAILEECALAWKATEREY